jgi:hypothetical protein
MTQPAPYCRPHTAVRLAAAMLLGAAPYPVPSPPLRRPCPW